MYLPAKKCKLWGIIFRTAFLHANRVPQLSNRFDGPIPKESAWGRLWENCLSRSMALVLPSILPIPGIVTNCRGTLRLFSHLHIATVFDVYCTPACIVADIGRF